MPDNNSLIRSEILRQAAERESVVKQVEQENIIPTDDEQKYVSEIIKHVADVFSADFKTYGVDDPNLKARVEKYVARAVSQLDIEFISQERIKKVVMMTAFGYGPLTPLIEDDSISEIIVEGFDHIVVDRNGRIEETGITFTNEEQMMTIVQRIVQSANRQLNMSSPIVDAELKDGSRVNAVIAPVAKVPSLNIRKFKKDMMDANSYIRSGTIDVTEMAFLKRVVAGKANIFVMGGTSTGKTTLLNILSSFIGADELIVTIEDTFELQLNQPNVRNFRTRESDDNGLDNITQSKLLKAALRQRPDRIIQGEARDGSIFDMIDAMSTGHEGSMGTIHANNPQHMCNVRIPNLFRLTGMDFNDEEIANLIVDAIEIIVHLKRYPDGRRRVQTISYVDGLREEDKRVKVVDIYRYDAVKDEFYCTGNIPHKIIEKARDNGVYIPESLFKTSRKEEAQSSEIPTV